MDKRDLREVAYAIPVYASTSKGAPLQFMGYRLFDSRFREIGKQDGA